jgi:predicted transcriptional regulator
MPDSTDLTKDSKSVSRYDLFDWEKFDQFLKFKVTLVEAAALMGVGPTALKRYIQEKHGMTFRDYALTHVTHTKFHLIQHAVAMAHKGSADMTKFCLKNLAGWTDKTEIKAQIEFSYEDFLKEQENPELTNEDKKNAIEIE